MLLPVAGDGITIGGSGEAGHWIELLSVYQCVWLCYCFELFCLCCNSSVVLLFLLWSLTWFLWRKRVLAEEQWIVFSKNKVSRFPGGTARSFLYFVRALSHILL